MSNVSSAGLVRDETSDRPTNVCAALPELDSVEVLAAELLVAFGEHRRGEALVRRAESRLLAHLREESAHRECGYSSFADFSREVLEISPRSAQAKTALHRTLEAYPVIEDAFLDGRLSACQVAALRPVLSEENGSAWVEAAQGIPVRELRRRVKESLAENSLARAVGCDGSDGSDGSDGTLGGSVSVSVSIPVPVPTRLAWDRALEVARRVLGYDAPVYACFEAMLAEVSPEAVSAAPEVGVFDPAEHRASQDWRRNVVPALRARMFGSEDRGIRRAKETNGPARRAAPRFRAVTRTREILEARRTLGQLYSELTDLEELVEDGIPSGIPAAIERFETLRLFSRPLRVLFARLLRHLRDLEAAPILGYSSVTEFAIEFLGLSERAVRDLKREADLFEDFPHLEQAFVQGRIGLGKARLISRLRPEVHEVDEAHEAHEAHESHIRRAERLTHRQFAREVRFLEKLAEFVPDVAGGRNGRLNGGLDGPLPRPGLEEALCDKLGLQPQPTGKCLRVPESEEEAERDPEADPAANPVVMRRLEWLLDRIILTTCEDAMQLGEEVSPSGRLELSPALPRTTIGFWAPERVDEDWHRFRRAVSNRFGPLPDWAKLTLLVREATETWLEQDPQRRPTQWKILERDEYRCQVPGCSSRKNLEVHHIRFRSQGGRTEPGNEITLCHAHHRHGVHEGRIAVSGTAPHELEWRVGRAKLYRGELQRIQYL